MKRFVFIPIVFFVGITSLPAQDNNWKAMAQKSDSAAFEHQINPELYNVAVNGYLPAIKKWETDSSIDADSLFSLLTAWNAYPKPKKTGIICKYWVQVDSNNKVPFFIYIPVHYDPEYKTPLLVYYKGGWLSRKTYPAGYAREIITDNPTFSYLDKYNTIEIFPALKSDLAIYGHYGYTHLQKMISEIKKIFNIDDNKIFLSGFSDGGKTVYNAASLVFTPFACFYPINSFPPSAPAYPNLSNRPIFSFVAEKDEITNYKSILTKAEYVNNHGGNWAVHFQAGKTHFYYPYEKEVLPVMFEHMNITSRNPLPNKISYDKTYNHKDFTGADWLQTSVNTKMAPTPYNFTDTVKTYSLDGQEDVYEYGKNTGQVRAAYFNNTFKLTTSQIDTVIIYISPITVDLSLPVKVIINGKTVFNEKVTASKSFMIDSFLKSFDRAQIFVNQIVIPVTD